MVAIETGNFLKMLNDASLALLGFLMWKVLGYIICKNPLWVLSCKVNPLRCQTNTCTTTNPTSVASIMYAVLSTGLFLRNGPSCKMIEAAHRGCFRSGMMSFVAQQLSLISSTGRPSLTRVDSYSRVRCLIRLG